MPEVGEIVRYVDPRGIPHFALVTAVWPGEYGKDNPPGLNLVFVSGDETKRDDYGRQTERVASVVHGSVQPAKGNYWVN